MKPSIKRPCNVSVCLCVFSQRYLCNCNLHLLSLDKHQTIDSAKLAGVNINQTLHFMNINKTSQSCQTFHFMHSILLYKIAIHLWQNRTISKFRVSHKYEFFHLNPLELKAVSSFAINQRRKQFIPSPAFY